MTDFDGCARFFASRCLVYAPVCAPPARRRRHIIDCASFNRTTHDIHIVGRPRASIAADAGRFRTPTPLHTPPVHPCGNPVGAFQRYRLQSDQPGSVLGSVVVLVFGSSHGTSVARTTEKRIVSRILSPRSDLGDYSAQVPVERARSARKSSWESSKKSSQVKSSPQSRLDFY